MSGNEIKSMNNRWVTFKVKGYSLIEVLIAFVVLALGITSIVSFQGRLAYDSGLSKARTEAANIAHNKLEEFRNYKDLATFDAISSSSDTVGPTGSSASSTIANLTNTYTRTWTVTNNITYKTIQIVVTWPDSGGTASQYTRVTLNTNIARIDPTQSVLSLNTTTTTTAATTTTTIAATTTTTIAVTTTTTASATTTTTVVPTTTTTELTTTTTSATTTSTTTSTTSGTTTTTVACACRQSGNSGNFFASVSSGSCNDTCCMNYSPKCSGNNCTFTAFCPVN